MDCFASNTLSFEHAVCYGNGVTLQGQLDESVRRVDAQPFDPKRCVRVNANMYACSRYGDQRAIAVSALAQLPAPTLPVSVTPNAK